MKKLRGGYTTGACAAAGVKAALITINEGTAPAMVKLTALDGTQLAIPIAKVTRENDTVTAKVVKFSGDDPDITDGATVVTALCPFTATGEKVPDDEIIFCAGEGVGQVTKPGLSVPVGEPAINMGPRKLIANVLRETGGKAGGFCVTVGIENGRELAKKTLNPILGIEGGLSVIGTTGVLRPMSEEAFKNSLTVQLDVAKASACSQLILVPGKIGADIAAQHNLPAAAVVQTSNFVGFMLEEAVERGFTEILILGHLGKLAKIAGGSFHTHNRVADARMEVIAAYAAANGAASATVRQILQSSTTEEALTILRKNNLAAVVCQDLAQQAQIRAERYIFGQARIGVVIATFTGELLGISSTAKELFGNKF